MEDVIVSPPTYKIDLGEQIYCVELSPYEWSQHLICVAMIDKIKVGIIKFQEEDDNVEDVTFTPIRTFHHETRAHAVSWSPETSLSVVPKVIAFCIAGSDFKIRLYKSNLNDLNAYQILEGHKDYVNSISYEPEGDLLASVSDDHTCKLWDVREGQKCTSTFYLTSPGVTACWHSDESGKLLVAEKNGLIRIYNVINHQAILSLDAGLVPLTSADWAPNPLEVSALAAGHLFIWDVSRPSRPTETRPLHVESGKVIKFSPITDSLCASVGRPDNQLKVTSLKLKQALFTGKLQLFGGLSWHRKLPYICAGDDRELHFWRLAGDEDNGDKSRTFVFKDEGHTLGNALCSIIAQYPDVQFCGYTVPHPAEANMHFRIQTKSGRAIDLLRQGLKDLERVCDHTIETFESTWKSYQGSKQSIDTS